MMKKIILTFILLSVAISFGFAKDVTLDWNGGHISFDMPDEIADLLNKNSGLIVDKLNEHNITQQQMDDAIKNSGAIEEVKKFYDEQGSNFHPLTDVDESVGIFAKDFAANIANNQLNQNIWAEAWMGNFVPEDFHIGAGLDIGVAALKLDGINTLLENVADTTLPFNEFIFPTISADLRVGGIFIPVDFSFNVFAFDSTSIDALSAMPFNFNYFTIGFDGRWAVFNGDYDFPNVSAGLGFAYTKGGMGIDAGGTGADFDFSTFNIYMETQISQRLLFFIPFTGFKLGFTGSSFEWNVKPDWNSVLGSSGYIGGQTLQELNILPETLGGKYDNFKVIPQFFGGFELDLFVINLTFFGAIDVSNLIWSAGLSVRLAW